MEEFPYTIRIVNSGALSATNATMTDVLPPDFFPNLDPIALFAPPERIRVEVARVLESYGHGAGHVFNLGHGVLQQTDPEHVRVLVDAVHELSATYHA